RQRQHFGHRLDLCVRPIRREAQIHAVGWCHVSDGGGDDRGRRQLGRKSCPRVKARGQAAQPCPAQNGEARQHAFADTPRPPTRPPTPRPPPHVPPHC